MLTKKPSALVYNWSKLGIFNMKTSLYDIEHLWDDIVVYSLPLTNNLEEDFARYKPDLIVSFEEELNIKDINLKNRYIHFDNLLWQPTDIANEILQKSINVNCHKPYPKISVFTPTYKTGDRIYRTYESLKSQTFTDWEWVVLDDSDDDVTWNILQEISKKDYRVKIHRLFPRSNGNVGLVKNRVASLCNGEWLVELDHDDSLLSECLEYIVKASEKFPDAGFIYSDVCEIYEDGNMKAYDHDHSGNWYGREDNGFCWGYAGHTWTKEDGKDYLTHHYPEINPLTIRFNIGMPNHVRSWKKEVYHKIGGHNIHTPVADDFELIIRTFLNTKMVHIHKLLYLQWNNQNSTVDNNSIDINRRARLIRDYYDLQIHNRFRDFGKIDWLWNEETQQSNRVVWQQWYRPRFEHEQYVNYIYNEKN